MNKKLKFCRICNSNKLSIFNKLKKMPLGDKYSKEKHKFDGLIEINILKCNKCQHLQTSTIPNRIKIYTSYLSRPAAINKNLAGQYLEYAKDLKKYINKKDLILDIGSNDGAFLKYFKNNGYKNIAGIEPAKNLAKFSNKNKILTFNEFLNEDTIEKIRNKFKKKAKIILNNHSLSNVSDINEVLFNVKSILAKSNTINYPNYFNSCIRNI